MTGRKSGAGRPRPWCSAPSRRGSRFQNVPAPPRLPPAVSARGSPRLSASARPRPRAASGRPTATGSSVSSRRRPRIASVRAPPPPIPASAAHRPAARPGPRPAPALSPGFPALAVAGTCAALAKLPGRSRPPRPELGETRCPSTELRCCRPVHAAAAALVPAGKTPAHDWPGASHPVPPPAAAPQRAGPCATAAGGVARAAPGSARVCPSS